MTTVTQSTRLIESDSLTYPVFLSEMAKYQPNTCFGPTVDSDILIEFGFEVVNQTQPPEGDVVVEGVPELRDGEWYQTWVVRSYSEVEASSKLEERKAVMTSQAESLRLQALAIGFPYRFPNGEILHVQVRTSDRGNISDYRTIAKEVIAAGAEMDFPFRVYENVTVMLTAQEIVDMADRTFDQVKTSYQVSWDYKEAIKNATSLEELPAAPESFFLPVAE